MVRTKGSNSGTKAVAAKAPRKALVSAPSSNFTPGSPAGSGASSKYAGGNPVCPRPTPAWQKGIGNFFNQGGSKENRTPQEKDQGTGSSSSASNCVADMDEGITEED
ncbi:PREDICTED: PCNA-associated factor-like [Branchiostoma belcheri]|uniref:PCNA-associated factor n=1 Tax=Branchiostoma belcheri TaxID=7741 RepID=A0A6P4XXZ2_BRABE|nr:PREDICTED: PCNA-associated factor-like [Branchiostoma belcheri]